MPDSPSDSKVCVLTHVFRVVSAICQTAHLTLPLLDGIGSTAIMKLKLLFLMTLIVVFLITAEVRIHYKYSPENKMYYRVFEFNLI